MTLHGRWERGQGKPQLDYTVKLADVLDVRIDRLVRGAENTAADRFETRSRKARSCAPESWFEDFGEDELRDGRAEVRIDPGFAEVTEGSYQVFLTPYGDSNGLFVSERAPGRFEVRELHAGKGSVAFGFAGPEDLRPTSTQRFATCTQPRRSFP